MRAAVVVLLLFIAAVSASSLAPLLSQESTTIVADEYIIVFKDTLTREAAELHVSGISFALRDYKSSNRAIFFFS